MNVSRCSTLVKSSELQDVMSLDQSLLINREEKN